MSNRNWINDLGRARTEAGVNQHEAEQRDNRAFISQLNMLEFKGPSSEEIALIAKVPVTAQEAEKIIAFASQNLGFKMETVKSSHPEKYLIIEGAKNIQAAARAGLEASDSKVFKALAERSDSTTPQR